MKAELKSAMKEAMKAKDKVRLTTIRAVLSAIQYEEMQRKVDELPEETILSILKNEEKKRQESIEFAQNANRPEEISQLEAEIATIAAFLPQQLSESELEKIICDIKSAQPDVQMGLVMKELKEKYFGQYDGKVASSLAKRIVG